MKKARISDLVDTSLYYAECLQLLAFNLTVNLGKALIKAVLRGKLLAGGSMKGCGTGRAFTAASSRSLRRLLRGKCNTDFTLYMTLYKL